MKDLPLIYPLSLLAIILFVLFFAAYAISAQAVDKTETSDANTQESSTDLYQDEFSFHERAAIWVCPLH